MNLKQRFSFIFSGLFSLVLATVTIAVYFLFSDFRQEEFLARLAEKAQTTAKLLIHVKEIDYNLQKIIDKNSINKLYNENTEIYDEKRKLIYSSNDTPSIRWGSEELETVLRQTRFFKKNGQNVVLGLYEVIDGHGYYILISAADTYDNDILLYLKYLLAGAFFIGTAIVWLLSFTLSKKALQPLDNFRKKIQEITDSNLKIRLSKAEREDEINALAGSFNQMMERIDNAYDRQKEFTSNASHELRTPVARIAAQLENLKQKKGLSASVKANLGSIYEDTFQLSEMISSLLAMADINSREHHFSFTRLRLDELVFNAAAELKKSHPHFKMKFEIENHTEKKTDPNIWGDEMLLQIALLNLFRNACNYSADCSFACLIRQNDLRIDLLVTNIGEIPDITHTEDLFTTFHRGSNTRHISGSGVGLSIVKRVLDYHHAHVLYNIIGEDTNQLIINFPIPVNKG